MSVDLLSDWRERYRVRISFVCGVIFIWRAQPRFLPFLILGMLVALLGILLRQWAAGCVRKMDELAMTGPYALVRHPLYVGSSIAAVGFVLASTSFSISMAKPFFDRTVLFWAFLWILFDSIYLPKIRKEELQLRSKFSAAYESYAARVPRFLPKKIDWSELDFSTFSWKLWQKNQEYWSFFGYFFICLILAARYHYSR